MRFILKKEISLMVKEKLDAKFIDRRPTVVFRVGQ